MKKFLLLLVSVCMALPQLCVAAPAVKKNVAVYVTGGIDSKIKRVIGSKMAEYLSDGLHFALRSALLTLSACVPGSIKIVQL